MSKFDSNQNFHINVAELHDILMHMRCQEENGPDNCLISVNEYILEPDDHDKNNLPPELLAEMQDVVKALNAVQRKICALDSKFHEISDRYC